MMTFPSASRLKSTHPVRRRLPALVIASLIASFAVPHLNANPPVTTGLVLRLESDAGVSKGTDGSVTRWADQSAQRNDVVGSGNPQLAAAATPAGRAAISFDGNGDKLARATPTGLPTGNNSRTVFLVSRFHGNTAWSGLAYGSGKSNAAFGIVTAPSSGELTVQGWGRGNDFVSTARVHGSGWHLHTSTLSSGSLTLSRDGTQLFSRSHTFATSNEKLVLGQEIAQLGYSKMDVAAALIYNRALSSTERTSVENYLRQKYLVATVANTAPSVTIKSPVSGHTATSGTSITLSGTATDAEDGTLSGSIEWRSSRDGLLGRGASLSTSALTVGSHTLSASVTDSRGASRTASVTCEVKAASTTTPSEPAPSPTNTIKLFNGTNLSGLYVWSATYGRSDPTGVFKVSNGVIRVASDLPYAVLTTEKEYDNYIMVLEFKWGTATYGARAGKARDAGILVHSHGQDGSWRGRHMAGIESQVMEGAMGDLMLLKGRDTSGAYLPIRMTVPCGVKTCLSKTWYCRGEYHYSPTATRRTFYDDLSTVHWSGWDAAWKDIAGFRGRNDLEKPRGEWNQFIVVCDGDRIEVYFNGVKVNEAFGVYPTRGKIQLQSEQAEYYIRRWELQPLN